MRVGNDGEGRLRKKMKKRKKKKKREKENEEVEEGPKDLRVQIVIFNSITS
jgi:hypothetical protein